VRCWDILPDNRLSAPYGAAAVWQRGINSARCLVDHGRTRKSDWAECRCGLYSFPLREHVSKQYFDVEHARHGLAVGAIAYWYPRQVNPGYGEVAAQYGAVAALLLPSHAHRTYQRQLQAVADQYGVNVVSLGDLADEVHRWVDRQPVMMFGQKAVQVPWYHRLLGVRQYVPAKPVPA
jgi:hypothetical protein